MGAEATSYKRTWDPNLKQSRTNLAAPIVCHGIAGYQVGILPHHQLEEFLKEGHQSAHGGAQFRRPKILKLRWSLMGKDI